MRFDNLPNAEGKLTKITTGTGATPQAVTEYQEFDILGRVKRSQQWVEGTPYGSPMTNTYNLSAALIEQAYPSGWVVKNTFEFTKSIANGSWNITMLQSTQDVAKARGQMGINANPHPDPNVNAGDYVGYRILQPPRKKR